MEYTLLEILEAREQRALRQKELLEQFPATLLCFTMNIPGPDKDGVLIQKGFQLGNRLLKGALKQWEILHEEKRRTPAGWEAFYCIDAPAEAVKTVAVFLEDKTPGGRVFDMDVLDAQGRKLDRESLGFPKRKCLLCKEDAVICGRSRSHSVQDLYDKTMELIQTAITEEVSRLAVQSLLCEVYATPKPGLVDQNNNGSHKDMDLPLFLTSTATLWAYFRKCVKIGLHGTDPVAVFNQLRQAGLEAEKRISGGALGVGGRTSALCRHYR
jgi:holo-ACP synthase/triphosphoribosyl-dephospho-CoA synthase